MNNATCDLLEQHFDTAFAAPDGIKKLRELILTLAMQGKLVPQDPNDPPVSELLKDIETEKKRQVKDGKIKVPKPLPPVTVEEMPYALPLGWVWVRLGEIGLINPRNINEDSKLAGFVPMPLIPWGYSENHQFEERLWGEIKKGYTHFADGDVGMAKITPCFENAKSCVFTGLPNEIGAGTTELHIFRNSYSAVVPRFLLHYLKNPHYISKAVSNMTGSAGQKRVPTPYFTEQPFPLPPLSEQHRIVAKIDQLMARCDALEKLSAAQQEKRLTVHASAIQQLLNIAAADEHLRAQAFLTEHFSELYTVKENVTELRKAILQLAMMGKLVPQDPNDPPASQLLKEIEAERNRLVKEENLRTSAEEHISSEEYLGQPNGWEYCRLGNLARFIDYRGKTPKKVNSGIPLITAKNVRFGFINRDPYEYISEDEYETWMTRGFPKVGDLLFTTEAPLGNIAVIDIKERFALAQRVICLQLHKSDMAPYLKYLFMSLPMQSQLLANATGMTATGIKSTRLKEIPIPIPPVPEQHRIVAKIDQLMALCDTLDQQIAAATIKQTELLNAVMAEV
ncbi:restriction endonuclease subunit S [Nitrosomonas sp.]|uniref:restriction endonuclease subunit S n=1 Tax=Nitrosomonas sp. TaxID=42353 RepID=UPI00272F1E48|nr:restriction endonuclease subunit S [Nitrosomonas sp.]MDP1786805.1 restriction endonuclease subunit S [Nitrosomonas sp.]MDP2225415.1 restriction endonuclease subunit S [Nitrosomonas sp.]